MDLSTLQGLGLQLPTGWEIAALVIFGIVGLIGWGHGRRQHKPWPKWLGLALMLYPYAVSGEMLLWVVGVGLTVALVLMWDR